MEPESKAIPQPTETGSAGTQDVSTAVAVVTSPPPPFAGLPIVRAVEGIKTVFPAGLGGEIKTSLVLGVLNQLSYELNEKDNEIRELKAANKTLGEQLAGKNTESAVLRVKLRTKSTKTRVAAICAFLAPVLLGSAVDIYQKDLKTLATIVGVSGAVLLIVATVLAWEGAQNDS